MVDASAYGGALRVAYRKVGEESALVLDVSGSFDVDGEAVFQAAASHALASTAHLVIANLAPSCFLDSTALHGLYSLFSRLAARHRCFVIVAPQARQRRLFQISGLDRTLAICRSEEEALRPHVRIAATVAQPGGRTAAGPVS